MDRENRPRGREKHVTGGGDGVHRRGSGLNTGGPVGGGNSNDAPFRGQGQRSSGGSRRGLTRAGGVSLPVLIIAAIAYFFVGGGTGSSSSSIYSDYADYASQSYTDSYSSAETGWTDDSNTGDLNTEVSSSARDKRTVIKGNGEDTVTIMVYMCGTDLESKSGMATSDLTEMTKATLSDKINLLVYTGGCTKWQNNVISNKVNQIYKVENGGVECLEEDMGTDSMTDPDNLAEYIQWCAKNYPANRNELILWDHGGGSISGYGYDEKNTNSGSMSLAGINTALKKGGVTFDFIGFDACLMATLENAMMLTNYADYLIASEETEPGVGWYYTNWLTKFSKNTSMDTVELGKIIVDDFVKTCASECKGQATTLSVIDLAELQETVPTPLSDFSESTADLIKGNEYKKVSTARSNTREFAQSSSIDQVDLIHLAKNLGTTESKKLATVLESAVKYNLTSSNMTNAYGISIYFPYKRSSYVDTMITTYEEIGMDDEYSKCIQEFASLETYGQVASGGSSSQLSSLLGSLLGSSGSYSSYGYEDYDDSYGSYNDYSSYGSSYGSASVVGELLNSFLSSDMSGITGLGRSNTEFLNKSDAESSAEYIAENQFDSSALVWTENSEGQQVIALSEDQWSLVQSLELNFFYDDGQGYVDLGLDNVFEWDDDGNLIGENDHTWLAINGQPVAYYYLETVEDGDEYTITGYVPAMLNGERVELMLAFDSENPYGYILGARTDYDEDTTLTLSKGLTELKDGDTLDFLCDYYSYEGEYQDSYYLGEQMTIDGDIEISNVDVGEGAVKATYRFTDIYQQHYWTEAMKS